MTLWKEADLNKARSRIDSGIPRPPKQTAAPLTPSKEDNPVTAPRWLRDYRIAEFDFGNGTDRIVFTGVPKDHTNAFLLHCQTFQP